MDKLSLRLHMNSNTNAQGNVEHSETYTYYEIDSDYWGSNCPSSQSQNCAIRHEQYIKHLVSIEGVKSRIEFIKGVERQDLYQDYSLSEIRIVNLINAEVESSMQLQHSYFTNSNQTKRLRLDGLLAVNSHNETMAPTSFSYNSESLPDYDSKSIDHWGYFNGSSNSSMIPDDSYNFNHYSREPHRDHMKACTLESITNPSGSKQLLELEPNEYGFYNNGSLVNSHGSQTLTAASANAQYSTSFSQLVFNMPTTEEVELHYFLSHDDDCMDPVYIELMDENGNLLVTQTHSGSNNVEVTQSITLPAGGYLLTANSGTFECYDYWDFPSGGGPTNQGQALIEIKRKFYSGSNSKSKYGGGLRIKKITVEDGNNLTSTSTSYLYNSFTETDRSSGVLISSPDYDTYIGYGYEIYKWPGCSGNTTDYDACDVARKFSFSVNPLGTSQGGYIMYKNVTQIQNCDDGLPCQNGRIESEFQYEPIGTSNEIIQQPQFDPTWKRGLMTAQRIFNSSNQILHSKELIYQTLGTIGGDILGLKAADLQMTRWTPNGNNYENPCSAEYTMTSAVYSYTSEKYALVTQTEKMFEQGNPSKFNTTQTDFSYDNNMFPVLVTTTNLESGIVTQTKNKYVGHYYPYCSICNDDQSAAIKALASSSNRVWATPIETITLKTINGQFQIIEGTINTFKVVNDKVLSDATYKLELEQPVSESSFAMSAISGNQFVFENSLYRKVAHIHQYDAQDRPIASQKENDILTTIIRDYTDGRPVAEIVNAAPNECAYTSFETDTDNGWDYSQSYVTSPNSPVWGLTFQHGKTGSKAFALSNFSGNIERDVAPGSYILSFWTTSTSDIGVLWSETATSIVLGDPDGQGWKYYEYLISSDVPTTLELTSTSSCLIDELRIYPADASMKTTSYNTDGTVRSECGANNRVTTYLYDSWKRLEWTLDDNWQILTHHQYHIKNQNDPNDHSWQKEQVVMVENMSKDDVINASPGDESVISTITYSDGLGRPVQSLSIRQAPNQYLDLVSINVYDGFGREKRKYLPFVSNIANNGDFITNAVDEVLDFYDSTPRVAETAFPFSETDFEQSPLGRPLRQGHAGAEWQLSTTHTIKTAALLNDANEVLLWTGNEYYANAMGDGVPRYYPANTLVKKEIEDEHGVKVWEYSNSLGQVVCKRVKVWTAGGDVNPYTYTLGKGHLNENEPEKADAGVRNFDSYFVYDELGRLLYELPAKFIFDCAGLYQFQVYQGGTNFEQFNGFATAYRYDHRSRQIEKKKPGEAWSEYVYNNLNQVVLSKSPELSSADDKWNYVKYDALGRPIQTGFYTSALTRENLQNLLDGITTHLWETKGSSPMEPYTGVSFPAMSPQIQVLTETYYDDYLFDINGYTYNYNSQPSVAQGMRLRGAVTGTKTLVLDGTNHYLTSVNYFDKNGRLNAQYSENILGGYDNILTEYDYTGKVTKSVRHFVKEVGGDMLTIENKFEYDHSGRPTVTDKKLVATKRLF
jgi:hypothetical protein